MNEGEGSLKNLVERVLQMNMVIIEEMKQQREQFFEQNALRSTTTTSHSENLTNPPSRPISKINIKPKEYNGTTSENVVTWLISLEEVMTNCLSSDNDNERISLAASLLGGTALQWFVNLTLKQLRPSSWTEFKDQLILQFQPPDFQENLRQQLLQLRQKHALQDYIHTFRTIVGQVNTMDELTQIMFFVNGLSANTSLYVRSKHPQTVEAAIREATTYDNVMGISKNNHVKYDPFLETSSTVELNAVNTRQRQRYTAPSHPATTKDDCFKFGLCFYCKEPGHRALKCPKKLQQQQPHYSTTTNYTKNDQG
jgi:hypothetical protein